MEKTLEFRLSRLKSSPPGREPKRVHKNLHGCMEAAVGDRKGQLEAVGGDEGNACN